MDEFEEIHFCEMNQFEFPWDKMQLRVLVFALLILRGLVQNILGSACSM
jgi:hypothetical protein